MKDDPSAVFVERFFFSAYTTLSNELNMCHSIITHIIELWFYVNWRQLEKVKPKLAVG